jgi:hypothetical protein
MFRPDEADRFVPPRELLGILEALAPGDVLPGRPEYGAALDDARAALAKWEAADPVAAVSEEEPDPLGGPGARRLTCWPEDFQEAFFRLAEMTSRPL